jgi:DNA-binding beta-propeller fold protein YncE
VALTPAGVVDLPPFRASSFDHGDVHLATGRIFVAHTGAGTVEVIDADRVTHVRTLPGCPEASGVLCVQDDGLVFAAARGAGTILVIDAVTSSVVNEVASGPMPNGLAWDRRHRLLLVADVEDMIARLLDPERGETVARAALPGRPRWCVYDPDRARFLVNIKEPACVAVIDADPFRVVARWPVATAGPHGLDLDLGKDRAFVACDGGSVAALELSTGSQVGGADIGGAPDAIWHNAERGRLYVAIGTPGLIDVVDTTTMTRCERLATEPGAHTTAFDPVRQRLAVFLPHSCRAALYRET